ncbi:hypothetical protein PoB_002424000 [Plakobranchus ocellatus]|uniref:Uncharacterized protein n=1 Tax=Plakobranchus ocellatus TaxID=259542 RepID=A0AAV3ZSZ1_9GAST|nr:hypothetical protein PoB_002424000 [Plakobranchus ocellatus]
MFSDPPPDQSAVVRLEPTIEKFLQTSGRVYYPPCHQRLPPPVSRVPTLPSGRQRKIGVRCLFQGHDAGATMVWTAIVLIMSQGVNHFITA